MSNISRAIRDLLRGAGNPERASLQSKYFKNAISFHGLRNPEVESLWKRDIKARVTRAIPDWREQLQLAYLLLRSDFSEEQQVGTHILVANLNRIHPRRGGPACDPSASHEHHHHHHTSFVHEFIDTLGDRVFSPGGIRDWGNCDSLSSRVICELIKRDASVADKIREWKDADYVWRRRSACVSFVKIARFGHHNRRIIDICTSTVQCQERFVQLGTGWAHPA